ncbi:MAG: hypothetical protein MJ078_06920, partial [Clostridia bacterium]|nr:hypothetical protein [Clostridia bacterium]
ESEETGETGETDEEKKTKGKKKAKGEKKKKEPGKKKKFRWFGSKAKTGEELMPFEEEEKTNPEICLYNTLVRHIADFKTGYIPFPGSLTKADFERIFNLVMWDYPEFFWVYWFG